MNEGAQRALDAQVAGCAESHQRLLTTLDALREGDCLVPSRLPGWSRGHVLSHLARNAESHVRMFSAATRGEATEQYEGGKSTRDASIEAGAHQTTQQHVADVRTTIYALEAAWASATAATWSGFGIKSHSGGARVAIPELLLMRWCEVEVHLVDLDIGFTWSDWNPLYVRYDLDRQLMAWRARKPMGLTVLPDDIQRLAPNQRLAWFYGRVEVSGFPPPEPY